MEGGPPVRAVCTPSLQTLALESSGFWDQEVGGKERAEKEATPPHPNSLPAR